MAKSPLIESTEHDVYELSCSLDALLAADRLKNKQNSECWGKLEKIHKLLNEVIDYHLVYDVFEGCEWTRKEESPQQAFAAGASDTLSYLEVSSHLDKFEGLSGAMRKS